MRLKKTITTIVIIVLAIALVFVSLYLGASILKCCTQPHLESSVRSYTFFGFCYIAIVFGIIWLVLLLSLVVLIIYKTKKISPKI